MKTTYNTFKELVDAHAAKLLSVLLKQIETGGDDTVSIADWLMVRKVKKHLANNDQL